MTAPRVAAGASAESTRPATAAKVDVGFRPEIQGLRAVAVLLVAVYHVWLGRVSGGVDVFLMLTGFLLTASLVRSVERRGRVGFLAFWSRLARRLFPTMAVVLLGTMAMTLLFLPESRWPGTLGEVIASALYFENWRLALDAVDYLAQTSSASPVQHIWSLSIQGQFYVLIPVLVALAAWWGRGRVRVVLGGFLACVFVVSLVYSVWRTSVDQPWAYFDTGARLWEFALGGLVALLLPFVRVWRGVRVGLGWLGVAGLVACGLVLQVSTSFPGWIALWPTGAALLVIVAGSTGSRWGVDRWLMWRPVTYVGDISYALYLWHWPVLVCYLAVTERGAVSVKGGVAILVLSVVLADVTTRLVDRGVSLAPDTVRVSFVVGLTSLLVAATASAGWASYLNYQEAKTAEAAQDPANYPGAAILEANRDLPDVPVAPTPSAALQDVPTMVDDGCQQKLTETEAITCTYGATDNPDKTIALVDSSVSAHWFPAVVERAERNNWQIVTLIKSGCAYSADVRSNEHSDECEQWQPEAERELAQLRPDLVVTTATRTSAAEGEVLSDGHVERWRQLEELGVDVLAVRDTPRAQFVASECVENNGAEACSTPTSYSMAATPPYDERNDIPENVSFADLTDSLCHTDGECPAVIGNVLVYRDRSHMTATYARTIAPAMEGELQRVLGS